MKWNCRFRNKGRHLQKKMKMDNASYKELLKKEIEQSLGRVLHSPSDFSFASESIQDRINEYLSATTLMRIWGYVNEPCKTRMSTYNILARFVSYPDFDSFVKHVENKTEIESEAVKSEHINTSDLAVGDRLEFTWNPGRRCLVEFLGDGRFKVLQVDNSKIQVGDTFTCHFFILNQPLHLFDMSNYEDVTQTYVAGKKTGLTSLKIVKAKK